MKTMKRHWTALTVTAGCGLLIVTTALTVLSQSVPVLTIAPLGTNQFSVTITNGVGGTYYDLEWTPVLANPGYPWTFAGVGTSGQTNFMLNMGAYQTGFYRALVDTNSIPLWEAADPNNPGAGILTVFIDSPANGFNITQ